MKLSQILYKQHIGRQVRSMWYIQGKKVPVESNAEKSLLARGIKVVDAEEIVKPKRTPIDFKQFTFLKSLPLPEDETHPDWKDRPCLEYNDNNLLCEGLPQAQQITKTVCFENVLPESVENLVKDLPQDTHELIKKLVKTSVIFDAHQELLPKLKDPNRPAWNFPRQYGITDVRKISNLSRKFIQLCDCIAGPQIAKTRTVIDNALLCLFFEKEFDLYKFEQTMDLMLMSENPLRPAGEVNNKKYTDVQLPKLYPLHHTLGLDEKNIYKMENLYPLSSGYHKKNIHTIFVYYDNTKVKNTTELESTETQIFARAMIKAFTVAASSARQRFGSDVKELPEPITVQCIQSDGKAFYFSVYQLNTLDIDGEEGMKNYSWILPKLNLYEKGGYSEGRPTLEGYNPEVFQRILAFYKNN